MEQFIVFITEYKDLITTLAAFAGFVLSFGQLILACWNKRIHFTVEIQNYEFYSSTKNNRHIFLLTINNLSSSPITITKVILNVENNKYSCYLTHQWHGEHYYPKFYETDIPRTERVFTVDFPIQLTAHQSFMGYISFPVPEEETITFENKKVSFQMITNKRTKTITVNCPARNNQSLSI